MQPFTARMPPWCTVSIVGLALGAFTGVLFVRETAFAAQRPGCLLTMALPKGRSPHDAGSWCVYQIAPGDTLGTIARSFSISGEELRLANRKRRIPGQQPVANRHRLTAGALLLLPPPVPSSTPADTPEPAVPPPAPGDQEPPSAVTPGTQEHIGQAQLVERQEQHARDDDGLASVKRGLEQQRIALDALGRDAQKTRSRQSINTGLLAVCGVLTIGTLSVLFASGILNYPGLLPGPPGGQTAPAPPPSFTTSLSPLRGSTNISVTEGHEQISTAGLVLPGSPLPSLDIQSAWRCLSSPKGEDVIRSARDSHYAAFALADGASSLRWEGGEITGGGAIAASIAAESAITCLTHHLCAVMGIEDMLGLLEEAFRDAREALGRSNASAEVPGATTLLIALLAQTGDGGWYWFTGHVGNGVLALIHTGQLLSSWPVTTALLSKHSNGVNTIMLPGVDGTCLHPALCARPHQPGDMLVIGSDGLEYLNAVTWNDDKMTFVNYLWKRVGDRSCLERCLRNLGNGDGHFTKALSIDDTTIGVILA